MGKKARTPRRKNKNGGEEGVATMTDDTPVLPDDHTIADSVSTLQSLHDEFQEKNQDGEDVEFDVSQAALNHAKVVDALTNLDEIASEKRSSRREQYLRTFFKTMTQYACTDTTKEVIAYKVDDTIIPGTLFSLRSSSASPAEQYAACRCLEATAIILGYGNDDFMEAIDGPLRKVVQATGRAIQVRLAALRALSMAYFICGTDIQEVYYCMNFCELVCQNKFRGEFVHELLRANAIECWALLATVVDDAELAGEGSSSSSGSGDDGGGTYAVDEDEIYEGNEFTKNDKEHGRGIKMLPLLQTNLEESNCVELKSACGEAVALIHEARLDLGLSDNAELNATQRKFDRGSWEGSDHEVIIDELKQLVSELALTSGHHMSKKAKKEQRATFREIQTTLVDNESPSDCINIGGTTLEVDSWKEMIQLNFIRHCLQSGFQAQCMTNETLWKIFGIDGNEIMANLGVVGGGMSQFEKRMTMGKTSEAAKAADQFLVKKRKNRTNAKNSFLTADGEDL